MGKLPDAIVQKMGSVRPGLLLRFHVGANGFEFDSAGNVVDADLHLAGVASRHRRRADSYSRIMFQLQMRQGLVSFDALRHKVACAASDDATPERLQATFDTSTLCDPLELPVNGALCQQ
jgi:hypothetical protein